MENRARASAINMSISETGDGEYYATYEIETPFTSLDDADFNARERLQRILWIYPFRSSD